MATNIDGLYLIIALSVAESKCQWAITKVLLSGARHHCAFGLIRTDVAKEITTISILKQPFSINKLKVQYICSETNNKIEYRLNFNRWGSNAAFRWSF